ncbi:Kcnh7, partial [Symbiodinium microadriaticum]
MQAVPSQAWMPVELTVDILFWIDLPQPKFLIFLFSYKDENLQVEVCDLKAIGCRYLKGFFFVNFLACVPPSWFSVLFSGGGEDSSSSLNKSLRLSRLHRTSRLARLARLGRLAKLAPFLHESATWKYIQAFRGVRMMNLTVGLMWVVHLMACGWYLCAALHEEPNDTWVARRSINNDGDVLMGQDPSEQWVHALYFILTIFTTVGFGDMSAFTTAETLYVDWAMIVGTVVNSIIMSEVITTLTGVDRAQAELNKRYALIKEFSEHARLSGKVTTAFEKAVEGLRFRRCGLRAQEVVPFLHDWRMVLAWAHHIYNMQTCLRLPCTRKSFFASDTLPRELMLDLTRDLFQ